MKESKQNQEFGLFGRETSISFNLQKKKIYHLVTPSLNNDQDFKKDQTNRPFICLILFSNLDHCSGQMCLLNIRVLVKYMMLIFVVVSLVLGPTPSLLTLD